jgi:hypothetical protein
MDPITGEIDTHLIQVRGATPIGTAIDRFPTTGIKLASFHTHPTFLMGASSGYSVPPSGFDRDTFSSCSTCGGYHYVFGGDRTYGIARSGQSYRILPWP